MPRAVITSALASCLVLAAACATPAPSPAPAEEACPSVDSGPFGREATSLLGEPLIAPELDADFRAEQLRLLAEAASSLRAAPDDAEALIWAARRNGYLGRYQAAIGIFGKGAELYPEDARFLRHRGHRYITTRQFDEAVRDLERAAELVRGRPDEIEPDGLPNDRNIPTSTLHSNIWYHLGLAHYLRGDFASALEAYRSCLEFSRNPDMLSATSHWLYMTLRRLGRTEEAQAVLEPIHGEMEIIENRDYHRLLMMYKGEADAEKLLEEASGASGSGFATTAYGIGNWYLYNDDPDRASEIFESILESDPWAAFGYVAAEAELAR